MNDFSNLEKELATMKVMIYSLYKSITADTDYEKLTEWEKGCEEMGLKILKENNNDE